MHHARNSQYTISFSLPFVLFPAIFSPCVQHFLPTSSFTSFANTMEKKPSWEANSLLASQEMTRILLWYPKVPDHARKSPPPVPILSQTISNLRLDISSGLLPSCFHTKPCVHLSSPQTYCRHHPSLFLLSLEPKCLSELPVLENPKLLFFLSVKNKFHTHINYYYYYYYCNLFLTQWH
jgi:hypothetical protein